MTQANGKSSTLGRFSLVRVVPVGTGRMVYVSGLTSGPDAPFDLKAQTEIIFRRMGELLGGEGAGLQHVVKLTAFLVDLREYGAYNEVRNRIFADAANPPASSSVGVSELVRPEARIEIEAVAFVPA